MKTFLLTLGIIVISCAHATPLKVAVFCSADDKASPALKMAAHTLGKQLAEQNFGLVTGGSRTGLMKEVVDGYVTSASTTDHLCGVMPQVLKHYNVHHPSIPKKQLLWEPTVHQRLATFHTICDAIVILPGGYGTLHELMDFLVHNQFGLIQKSMILLNLNGYWSHLLAQFHVMREQQLLTDTHMDLIKVVASERACIQELLKATSQTPAESGLQSLYWEESR